MTIKVFFKLFCHVCGTQVYLTTDDPDIFYCEKCKKDFMRGDLKETKEVKYDT